MERELQCPDCGRKKWIADYDESNVCGAEMDTLTNDRCNGCGRELMGRAEHEMGLCPVCTA